MSNLDMVWLTEPPYKNEDIGRTGDITDIRYGFYGASELRNLLLSKDVFDSAMSFLAGLGDARVLYCTEVDMTESYGDEIIPYQLSRQTHDDEIVGGYNVTAAISKFTKLLSHECENA